MMRWAQNPTMRAGLASVRSGAGLALVLAGGLGLALAVGANLSNAWPSAAHPFGWPGASNFDNAVAMVRPELVLAGSLPALLLGVRSGDASSGQRFRALRFLGTHAGSAVLLAAAAVGAASIGSWAASGTRPVAYWAFAGTHLLLAMAFYSLGVLAAAVTRRHAVALALAIWTAFVVLFEDVVRWQLFRQAGYNELAAGHFPTWFYAMQALSPVASYRAVLILARPAFRDGLEHATLDHANIPDWLTAGNFSSLMAAVWIVIPLALAAAIIAWRGRSLATTGRAQSGMSVAIGPLYSQAPFEPGPEPPPEPPS
jgi:hypothetical protein